MEVITDTTVVVDRSVFTRPTTYVLKNLTRIKPILVLATNSYLLVTILLTAYTYM